MGGKTETSRKRRVEVWLPTLEAKKEWTAEAKKRRKSVSKFVIDAVAEHLADEDSVGMQALIDENENLAADNDRLMQRIEELGAVVERQADDIVRFRELLGDNPAGILPIDPKLFTIFEQARDAAGKPRPLTQDDVQRRLGVDRNDLGALNSFNMQLERMELGGVIERTRKGWRWNVPV